MPPCKRISIVDDDISVREALPDLIRQFGFTVETFGSGDAFLASTNVGQSDCLILDVQMPGMSGPELKRELDRRGYGVPVIFITAHAQSAASPEVQGVGAACLIKPFTDVALLDALNKAMAKE